MGLGEMAFDSNTVEIELIEIMNIFGITNPADPFPLQSRMHRKSFGEKTFDVFKFSAPFEVVPLA